MLEENHNYPFGLTMAGISDKAIKTNYSENKFRYNEGTELQNKEFSDGTGLEVYDAGFRTLDPQLGRFSQIDPLADYAAAYSTYAYGGDNPVTNVDPEGLKEDPFTAMTSLLNTQYGGTWNAQDGSEPYYVSGDQSFAMGAIQAGQDGWWGSPGAPSSFDQALYNYNGGAITSGMAATLFSVTWGNTGQATDVSAADTYGGFNISGTATSDGSNFSGYFVSDDLVREGFENLAQEGTNSGTGNASFGNAMFAGTYDGVWNSFTSALRQPDYYSLNISIGYYIEWNLSINVDKYWHVYISPYGGGVGYPTGLGFSATANWIQQNGTPTAADLNAFLTGNSYSFTAGIIGGFQTTYSPSTQQTAIGVGFMSPQIGITWNYQPSKSLIY
jgi:RHS repeat-associated protein